MQYDAIQAEIDAISDQRRELCRYRRWSGQDLFFYILAYADLVLLQQLRLELPLAVSGNGDVHLPEAGTQSL